MSEALCHCGQPLHYSDQKIRAMVEHWVERLGEHIIVTDESGRKFKVPRHYIALHGIKAAELDSLGFEEA